MLSILELTGSAISAGHIEAREEGKMTCKDDDNDATSPYKSSGSVLFISYFPYSFMHLYLGYLEQ